jgi:hypothetical protein
MSTNSLMQIACLFTSTCFITLGAVALHYHIMSNGTLSARVAVIASLLVTLSISATLLLLLTFDYVSETEHSCTNQTTPRLDNPYVPTELKLEHWMCQPREVPSHGPVVPED